jgi:hypothetical protein
VLTRIHADAGIAGPTGHAECLRRADAAARVPAVWGGAHITHHRWNDYTATLPKKRHERLMRSLGTARDDLRRACDLAATDGEVDAVRDVVFGAIEHLRHAGSILGPVEWGMARLHR